jgi:hypothetical protein
MFAELQEIAGGVCAGTLRRSTSCDLISLGVHFFRQTQSVEIDHSDFGTSIKVTDFNIILKWPINTRSMLQHKVYKYGAVNYFTSIEW